MKLFIALLVPLLTVSCADKNPSHKKNPLQDLRQSQLNVPKGEGFVSKTASKKLSFKTSEFEFILDSSERSASLILVGEEARALHKGMFGKTKDDEKTGVHFTCKEVSARESQCRFLLDWKNGEVLPQALTATEEEHGKKTPFYQGTVLTLGSKKSYLTLTGNLAFTLYSLLEVSEIDKEKNTLQKQGINYACSKTTKRDEGDSFSCLIKLDPLTGKVI